MRPKVTEADLQEVDRLIALADSYTRLGSTVWSRTVREASMSALSRASEILGVEVDMEGLKAREQEDIQKSVYAYKKMQDLYAQKALPDQRCVVHRTDELPVKRADPYEY